MVKTYVKGAKAERELACILKENGFVVIRAAGSGGAISTPDLVAIKKGMVLAFEIKSWSTKPSLRKKELIEFKKWCKISGALGFFTWRRGKNNWVFLEIKKYDGGVINGGLNLKDFLFTVNL
jgi:Holliday junction resolvase